MIQSGKCGAGEGRKKNASGTYGTIPSSNCQSSKGEEKEGCSEKRFEAVIPDHYPKWQKTWACRFKTLNRSQAR
jgi:hypothetical protein